jgi:prepilin-type N-terminal cleavage/methylation domain-containing protein
MSQRRAFTLLELLVVIGIIVLLASLVFVAFRNVRAGALRTEGQGAIRQMIMGYNGYSGDNKMRLMPGYLDSNMLGTQVSRVTRKHGTIIFDPADPAANCNGQICDASSYVWRLAPYMNDAWKTYLVDYQSKSVDAAIDAELRANVFGPGSAASASSPNPIGLADAPSFGLNSIYVGGDTTHGGQFVDYHPWQNANPTIAATRLSEVRNPSKLIVFAPTGQADASGSGSPYQDFAAFNFPKGYAELRPPKLIVGDTFSPTLEALQWTIGESGALVSDSGANLDPAGLPIARWGKEIVPVANLDGSCSMESMSNLSADMSRWRPFE